MRPVTKRILSASALAMVLAAGASEARAEMSSAVRTTNLAVAGLEAPAEILVDYWGIAHIYAEPARRPVLARLQRGPRSPLADRSLAQAGLGLLARDFGSDYVPQDRAARLFLYRGDMEAEWQSYGPDARATPKRSWPASTPMSVTFATGGELPRVPSGRHAARPVATGGCSPHPKPWSDAKPQLRSQAGTGCLRCGCRGRSTAQQAGAGMDHACSRWPGSVRHHPGYP